MKNLMIAAFFTALVVATTSSAQQAPPAQQPPPPTPQQRVAMLQQWLKASQVQLRAYQWVETTVLAKAGEEKSRQQNQVYYGADGQLVKVPAGSASGGEASAPRGPLRKHAAAQAKEDLTAYLQQAAALAHSYVPPDPNRIQQSVNAGNFAVNMVVPGRQVRLDFKNYLKAGDVLSVDIELPTNRLMGMQVSSYLDTQTDAVKLDVTMGLLPDGTIYTAVTKLAAPAKDITVTIENAGHRRLGG